MEWLATLGMHRTVVVLNDRRARRQTDPHHFGAAIRQPRPGRHRGALGSTPASGRRDRRQPRDVMWPGAVSVCVGHPCTGCCQTPHRHQIIAVPVSFGSLANEMGTSQLACPPTTSLGYREQIADGKARQEAG